VQPAGLKQNWNSALPNNGLHLLSVEFEDVSWLPFDIGAAYKLRVGAQSFSGPAQHVKFFRFVQIIDVAGVHVHGIHQSGAMRGTQMILKGFDRNSPIRFKWQERRGDALHLAAKLLPLIDGSDFHRFALAIFSFSASAEVL